MYKKILVPVDGSPTSVGGLHEAIKLAKDQGATLRMLLVVDALLMEPTQLRGIDDDAFRKARRESGQRTLAQMQAIAGDHSLETEGVLVETIAGRAADSIVDAARQWPADLIVMGTHGRRGVQRLLMGSDASLVLHSTPVPVLLVRPPANSAEETSSGAV